MGADRRDPVVAPLGLLFFGDLGPKRCGSAGCFERESVVATTAMRLVPALGSNPGLPSFLGQPFYDGGLKAVGVGMARTRRRETSAFPSAISVSRRETTPSLLRGFATETTSISCALSAPQRLS